ncbi:sensor histidine kinase [Streptosporangium lutulentum]|nr:sensor histidine kinase [Streptosporangium lutulentum]
MADTEAEPFAHPALFYRGSRQYLDGVVPFVREGLEAGEPVAVAVPGRNLEPLRAELGEMASEVRFFDMAEAGRNPGRIIPGVLRAFADPHPSGGVRIVSESIWPGRSAVEYPACVQHEALINLAFSGRAVTVLCPYDLEGLDPEVIKDAEATHPVLLDDSGSRSSGDYAPERIVRDYNRPLLDPPPAVAVFAFGHGALALVRTFAVDHAARAGLAGERLEDLRLIVSELAANSLDHGGGAGVLRVWPEGRQVIFDISDAGHITDPLAGRRPVTPRQRGCRGLLVTNLLGDLVRVHTGPDGTTVRVHFDLR